MVVITTSSAFMRCYGEKSLRNRPRKCRLSTWSNDEGELRPVAYNAAIPIEYFDFIVTDECHRSIYGLWRQVLEYFDAHLISLTATPSKHTLASSRTTWWPNTRTSSPSRDGVNVGFEVFRIRTRVGDEGGVVDADYHVPVRDRRTRAIRYKQLDDDLPYAATDLDSSVTVPNQIRAVLRCYRDPLH